MRPAPLISASAALVLLASFGASGGCSNEADKCERNPSVCPDPPSTSSTGGAGGSGGVTSSTTGGGGTGGAPGCTTDAECTDPMAAKCNTGDGTCVPCDASTQCEGLTGTEVCATSGDDAGTCIQCNATEGCTAAQTCNLLDNTCVDVAPTTVDTCSACTNDAQCVANHRCVPMEFPTGTAHGYFCLEIPNPSCSRPFGVFINEASINGEAATNYCGIDEDSTTCEAVNALLDGWVCSGNDGMCSPDGIVPEVAVPGALCRQVGALANQCTYACAVASECPAAGPPSSCGDGPSMTGPPDWCGG